MQPVQLTIEGMSCGHCVDRVTKTLQQLDGVEVDAVRIGSASVRVDATSERTPEIVEALRDEGYEATVASR